MRRKLQRAAGLLLHLGVLPCRSPKIPKYFSQLCTALSPWVHLSGAPEPRSQRRLQHAIVDAAAAPQTWMSIATRRHVGLANVGKAGFPVGASFQQSQPQILKYCIMKTICRFGTSSLSSVLAEGSSHGPSPVCLACGGCRWALLPTQTRIMSF